MSSFRNEMIGAQLATLFGIIVVLVITGCIAGRQAFNSAEPFSPLGFASDCPAFKLPNRSRFQVNSCGPGCYLQSEIPLKKSSKNNSKKESKTEMKVDDKRENFEIDGKRDCTTDRIPEFQKQLPIGHLSTMGSPLTGQASCTSNINGVQRLSDHNPYGELVKKYGTDKKINQFTQSYAACEFGANNIFDKNMLKY